MSPPTRWLAGGILPGNPVEDTLAKVAGAEGGWGVVGNEVTGKYSQWHGEGFVAWGPVNGPWPESDLTWFIF